MATPELAIAKASFSALLFRKEPVSLTRPEIETFHTLLHDAIHQCSPANVQKCKRWILKNLAPSPARVAALGKYLAALSKSFPSGGDNSSAKKTKPSSRRKRLHVLYILNDVLYHAVVRDRDARLTTELQPSLTPLFHSAASFHNCPKHVRKLEDLLGLWNKQRYFSAETIDELRETVKEAPHGGKVSKAEGQGAHDQTGSNLAVKPAKDAPYMIPSMHGDPNTPWFDLPAANWLPHLEPNSTKPMNPSMIKPLQLAPGPADKALAKAVKDLLADVERLYSKSAPPQQTDQAPTDFTEMGERVVLDEITGEVVDGETYYGWSRGFCTKMKQRKQGKTGDGRDRGRSISRSRSRSFSRGRSSRSDSPPAFKRRRLSPDSRSPSRSRSRSRDRRRSPPRRGRFDSRDYSRSRSRSRSRSVSGSRNRYRSRSRSADRSGRRDRGDSSRSPLPPHSRGRYESVPYNQPQPPPPPPPPNHHTPPAFPPYLPPPPNAAVGFGHFPPPPPPPPQGFQGTWPPAPPHSVPYMGSAPRGWGPPPPGPGVPPPPPPNMGGWAPPPPPQSHNQFQQYGRGNGGYRGRGRGGYDRGRGGW
ncbi:hypothetical protein CkaCkLH20_01257 [Colletotrichum karsti]|uniref:CID domain-containing protein n=1 Tax=Colletotrichum karsti TaxID=1095194 RepID=A0A9P6IEU8_9PEZI|nr:uncharacterized protein CkaCkLH20_01257 [Colletotrichum karsti]KAF9881107.1 hypothetical protein CkaCkLH20_01257 [Colletotrichum karsti]